MIKVLLILILSLVALLAQGALGHCGLPDFLMPQLLIVLVIFLSFGEANILGCFMAFVSGLLLDFSSAVLIGPWAGAFVVLFGVLALLSQRLFVDSVIAAMVITFVSVAVTSVLFSVLSPEYPAVTWEYPLKVVGQALSTALLAPLVLKVFSKSMRRTHAVVVGRGTGLSLG